MLKGVPFILRLCDHKGECVDVEFNKLRLDGHIAEVRDYDLDDLIDALSAAEFELGQDLIS